MFSSVIIASENNSLSVVCLLTFAVYFITEFLSQFEMNAEMDISKNQWRPTGGKNSENCRRRLWMGP